MTTLNASQIRQYAYNAGFRGADLDTAVAVALAESGGNTQAYNPELASSYSKPGGGSRGLWQIFGSVHPNYNSSIAFDPATNAKGAFEIYQAAGNKFTPWSAYNKGTYTKFLGSVGSSNNESGSSGGIASNVQNAISNTASSVQNAFDIQGALQSIVDYIGQGILGKTSEGTQRTTADLIFFLAGFALVILGLVILGIGFAKEPIQKVVTVATKAAADKVL